jgi:hypothetical protein
LARADRTGQQYPTFALLATLFRTPSGGRKVVTPGPALFFRAVAAEKSDQPGVLGNLPRSRPGQRSQKRSGSRATTAAKPAAPRSGAATKRKAAAARKRAAARKPSPARRRATTSTARTPAAEPAPTDEPAPTSADPLTTAFHVAGKVAELGLKTAGGIIRRLPGL